MGFRRRKAIVVDLDGFLCDTTEAVKHLYADDGTKDFVAFHEASRFAPRNQAAFDWVVKHRKKNRDVIILTGRKQMWRDLSVDWLAEIGLPEYPYVGPFMRDDTDARPGDVFKQEVVSNLLQTFDIVEAGDDDPRIIRMYNRLRIPAFYLPSDRANYDLPALIAEANVKA